MNKPVSGYWVKVKVLDGTEHNSSGFRWIVSTIYYDDKYRPIQTLRDLYSTVTTDNEILSISMILQAKSLKPLPNRSSEITSMK